MTKELLQKMEIMASAKFYQEDVVPVLELMREEARASNDSDHDEKITAFLRGRISALTELITVEENLRKRLAEAEKRQKEGEINASRRRNPEPQYIER